MFCVFFFLYKHIHNLNLRIQLSRQKHKLLICLGFRSLWLVLSVVYPYGSLFALCNVAFIFSHSCWLRNSGAACLGSSDQGLSQGCQVWGLCGLRAWLGLEGPSLLWRHAPRPCCVAQPCSSSSSWGRVLFHSVFLYFVLLAILSLKLSVELCISAVEIPIFTLDRLGESVVRGTCPYYWWSYYWWSLSSGDLLVNRVVCYHWMLVGWLCGNHCQHWASWVGLSLSLFLSSHTYTLDLKTDCSWTN